ncbi:hypothetical protein ACFYUK_42105 [Nonomuraea wenchangensis]
MSHNTAADVAAPATMRAVVVTRPGGLEALEIKDVPVLVRAPGWVRIKVKAFGVNESGVTTRRGESDPEVTYPRVPPGSRASAWSTRPTRTAGCTQDSRSRP